MKPRFSIVIPAFNEEAYIGRCLQAIVKQKGCSPFEVIVVDNGSTDKTVQICKKYHVRLIKEPTKGVARARKTGADMAKGEFLVNTDADAAPPPDWLATIETLMDAHPETVAVSGPWTVYDRGWFLTMVGHVVGFFIIVYDRIITLNRCHITCANSAIRLSAYKKVGGYKESLSFGEDIELSRRLWKVGRVRLTFKLKTIASSRRYQLTWGMVVYAINFFLMTTIYRVWKNELSEHREIVPVHKRVHRRIRSAVSK